MDGIKLVDKTSLIMAGVTLIFAFILFFSDTGEVFGSFAAAFLAAGLVWVACVLVRWLVLALK